MGDDENIISRRKFLGAVGRGGRGRGCRLRHDRSTIHPDLGRQNEARGPLPPRGEFVVRNAT